MKIKNQIIATESIQVLRLRAQCESFKFELFELKRPFFAQ